MVIGREYEMERLDGLKQFVELTLYYIMNKYYKRKSFRHIFSPSVPTIWFIG